MVDVQGAVLRIALVEGAGGKVEGVARDADVVLRECDVGQLFAVGKGDLPDLADVVGDGHRGQRRAGGKGAVIDGRERPRQIDALDRRKAGERLDADRDDGDPFMVGGDDEVGHILRLFHVIVGHGIGGGIGVSVIQVVVGELLLAEELEYEPRCRRGFGIVRIRAGIVGVAGVDDAGAVRVRAGPVRVVGAGPAGDEHQGGQCQYERCQQRREFFHTYLRVMDREKQIA